MTFYVFSFSIDINVDKICVRITVNSSWLIYLLNLGTCMEHLRQWTKEARSSFKLLVEITKGLQVEELVENKESSFSVEEDFVSDDDATHPFSQKEHNDLVCVHLKMVKLLLGQQSGYHGRWDAAMTDYCWTLKRDV